MGLDVCLTRKKYVSYDEFKTFKIAQKPAMTAMLF